MRLSVVLLMALLLSMAVQLHAQDNSAPEGNPVSQNTANTSTSNVSTSNVATFNVGGQKSLTQTVTSKDGMITAYYPENWKSKHYGQDIVTLTNNAALLERGGLVLPDAGEIYIQITYVKRSRVLQPDGTVNLHNILTPIADGFADDDGNRTFSDPASLTVGEFDASHTVAELDLAAGKTMVYMLAVDRPESRMVILVTSLTAVGELPQFQPIIYEITTAVEVQAKNIPHVVAGSHLQIQDVVFDLPDGWFGKVDGESAVVIASSAHLLDNHNLSDLYHNDVIYFVRLANREEILAQNMTLADLAYSNLSAFGDDIKDGIRLDMTINGYEATGFAFTAEEKENPVYLYYLFVDFEAWNKVMVVVGVTHTEALEALISNALEIAKHAYYEDEIPVSNTSP